MHASKNIYDSPNSSSRTYSWIKTSTNDKNCLYINHTKEGPELSEINEFSGYALPVILVK